MNLLIGFALWLSPPEYAREYRDEISHDIASGRFSIAAIAADVAVHGLMLRFENIARNIRTAVRSLTRSPMYSLVAMCTIALAIGTNITVASVLTATILSPLPYPHADRIAAVGLLSTRYSGLSSMPYPDVRDIETNTSTLARIGAVEFASGSLLAHGHPVALNGFNVSGGYFDVTGAPPLLGRTLNERDLGTQHIVLSETAWRKYFGEVVNPIGMRVRSADVTFTVVGIMPADFRDPIDGSLYVRNYWVPINPRVGTPSGRGNYAYYAIARLKPGASIEAAHADLSRALGAIIKRFPDNHVGNAGIAIVPISQTIIGSETRSLLWLLYAAAGVIVLIASANVGNLALVRAGAREPDRVVQSALGASQRRLVEQTVTESAVLGVAGGAAGLALAALGLRLLEPLTRTLPRGLQAHIDGRIIAYTTAVILITIVLSNLLPVLLGSSSQRGTLNVRGSRLGRPAATRMRFALVALEVGLAVTVTISAGLLIRSFVALVNTNTGIDAHNVYQVPIGALPDRYDQPAGRATLAVRLRDAIMRIPGVEDVAASSAIPFVSAGTTTFRIPGTSQRTIIPVAHVQPAYFHAFRIPLLAGRTFTDADRNGAAAVAIVNAKFARTYFGRADAVGRHILVEQTDFGSNPVQTVVGVVADARKAFDMPPEPTLYLPVAQLPRLYRYVIRTAQPVDHLGEQVATAMTNVDPALAPGATVPISTMMANNSQRAQDAMLLFTIMALVALSLALAGIYGVTASSVEQRTHEFGIRKAIGARSNDVICNVLRGALAQTLTGIALGVVATAAITSWLATILFSTSPHDPLTFAATITLLLICTLIAAIVPAVRAVRIAPARALRYE